MDKGQLILINSSVINDLRLTMLQIFARSIQFVFDVVNNNNLRSPAVILRGKGAMTEESGKVAVTSEGLAREVEQTERWLEVDLECHRNDIYLSTLQTTPPCID